MANHQPTIDEDLDQVVRSGAGRRVLMKLLMPIQGPIGLGESPEKTAYQLGYVNFARELDEWIKGVNLQCWMLMHREHYEGANDDTTSINRED